MSNSQTTPQNAARAAAQPSPSGTEEAAHRPAQPPAAQADRAGQPKTQPPAPRQAPVAGQPPAQRPPAPAQAAGASVVAHPAAGDLRLAQTATPRRRHRLAAATFTAFVAAPSLAAVAYLYGMAADQYASRVAFSIRSAENAAPVEFLGALTGGGIGAGPDAEIIYEFIRSQQMVETAAARLPLERYYNIAETDIVFSLGEDQPIEDVIDYWNWMTDVSYDSGSGIVNFEARAFAPEHAREIAALVLEESTALVNALSLQAREDAVSVAREVLVSAEDRLRAVRRDVKAFRDVEQELDPTMNAAAALSLVADLESELARARIDLASQLQLVGERSPRIAVLRERIESFERQIVEEKRRLGAGAGTAASGRALSDLLAEYEDLEVEREFAENAYLSALESFELAQVEARRQMRFLAPHIHPTLSVEAQHPQRALMSFAIFALLLVSWSVLLLVLYNVRDRR
jgi:capsular polysaccharide transport system permease protein